MGASGVRKEARKQKFSSSGGENSRVHSPATPETEDRARNQTIENPEVGNAPNRETNASQAKHQRFIIFIGNLPYTATDASVRKHFAKVQPKSVRHRLDKGTEKSKGFAFLEFEGYDRMKTCLQLYHHSNFDDGKSPARKLNVELTVGGGGAKSRERKSKLRAKNEKLAEERRRRLEEAEKTAKATKTDKQPVQKRIEEVEIHPSRRSRVTH